MKQKETERSTVGKCPEKGRIYRYAFGWLTVILLFALLLAGLIVSIANDMYAFVKPNRPAVLEVESPTTLEELSARLDELGVVQNPTVFGLYVRSKGRAERVETFSGTLEVNASMSYRELLSALLSAT